MTTHSAIVPATILSSTAVVLTDRAARAATRRAASTARIVGLIVVVTLVVLEIVSWFVAIAPAIVIVARVARHFLSRSEISEKKAEKILCKNQV